MKYCDQCAQPTQSIVRQSCNWYSDKEQFCPFDGTTLTPYLTCRCQQVEFNPRTDRDRFCRRCGLQWTEETIQRCLATATRHLIREVATAKAALN